MNPENGSRTTVEAQGNALNRLDTAIPEPVNTENNIPKSAQSSEPAASRPLPKRWSTVLVLCMR